MEVPRTVQAQKEGRVQSLDPQPDAYRLEIDEFVQNDKMLNLFLLALEALQNNAVLVLGANPTEKQVEEYWWSYFSIAGIHGWPKEPWSHKHKGINKGSPGYCQHGTTLFPTWHRPYVMMIEQAIFNKMYEIANLFSDKNGKAEYLQAARTFRLPYWDPWMPRNTADVDRNWSGLFGVPLILRTQEVFVRLPENPKQLVRIDNPLYRYRVPSEKGLKIDAIVNWKSLIDGRHLPESANQATVRTPASLKASSNNNIILDYELRSQAVAEQSRLWQLICNLPNAKTDWETFSNHTASHRDPEVSIESWHDNFHTLIGRGRDTNGNMFYSEVAAFDPMFWLHHCNIDRILALWQALHPDRYVPPTGELNIETPLNPFYKGKKDTDLWDSTDAKDWKQCGFAVPGTKDVDKEKLQKTVAEYINFNYLWIASKAPPPKDLKFPRYLDHVEALIGQPHFPPPPNFEVRAVAAGKEPELVTQTILLDQTTDAVKDRPVIAPNRIKKRENITLPDGAFVGSKQRTWNAHLKVRKFAFNGPFTINVFFEEPDTSDSAGLMLLANQVGFSGIFVSRDEARCKNCDDQREKDVYYADVIPLTTILVECLQSYTGPSGLPQHLRVLESLEPEHVVPYLTKNLAWRINTNDPEPKTQQEVIDSGLQIKVMDRWYNMPTNDVPLGTFEDPSPHVDITRGKAGGFSG